MKVLTSLLLSVGGVLIVNLLRDLLLCGELVVVVQNEDEVVTV